MGTWPTQGKLSCLTTEKSHLNLELAETSLHDTFCKYDMPARKETTSEISNVPNRGYGMLRCDRLILNSNLIHFWQVQLLSRKGPLQVRFEWFIPLPHQKYCSTINKNLTKYPYYSQMNSLRRGSQS